MFLYGNVYIYICTFFSVYFAWDVAEMARAVEAEETRGDE